MKNPGFIGPFMLTWTIILTAGTYISFYSKLTLESIVMRYGRIFFNFEIWRFITPFFSIAYPTTYTKLFIFILIAHLRQYEYYPFQVTKNPNEICDFVFTILYSMIGFWIVCLFYPLYYGPYFVIMTLLTLTTMRDKEETFNFIGFSVKRCRLPIIYALVTYVVNGTIMCELFAILWGNLLINWCSTDSAMNSFIQKAYKRLQSLLGFKEITYTSAETMRKVNLKRFE